MSDTMVMFRSCLSSEVASKEIINGSIILCSDSGEFFYDNLEGERVRVAKSTTYLNTDNDRTSMLTPEADMLYVVIETGLVWIYSNKWVCLNAPTTTYFTIDNIEVPTGSTGVSISDARITANCVAEFHAIAALYDLASNATTTCTCSNGSVKIVTNCAYPLIGRVEIVKP